MCQRFPPPGMLLHQNSRSSQLLVNRGLIEEMPLSYLLSSCGNLEAEPSRAKGGIVSQASQNQHKTIKIKIGSDGESKALTGRCQDDKLSSATAIQGGLPLLFIITTRLGGISGGWRHTIPCFVVFLQEVVSSENQRITHKSTRICLLDLIQTF